MNNLINPAVKEKYTVVIGLEVHAQLLTKYKMFAPEPVAVDAPPNTHVSPVTLAHPGTLPMLNKTAVEYAIKMGLACHAAITRKNVFARKNYFYPDLPKGYQITQDQTPICRRGYVTIDTLQGNERNIGLERIHLEEDTGKSLHGMVAGKTLLDFNRAGVPLIEIVTEPDLRTSQEAYDFLTEVRKLVRYLEICDGNMEEGSLRCDANISMMPKGSATLGQKVEVKNMNSIRNVQLSIEYEVARQVGLLEKGEKIAAETRAYEAEAGITKHMRFKESASDYCYFPEPDLSPLVVNDEWIAEIRKTLPPLPKVLLKKFRVKYQLSAYDARVLTNSKAVALFFESICQHTPHYKAAANWVMGPVKSYLNEQGLSLQAFPLSSQALAQLIALVETRQVSFSIAAQKVYPLLLQNPTEAPHALAQRLDVLQDNDSQKIQSLIDAVLAQYPDKVAAYRKGKKGLMGLFMGEIMKKSQGKAHPATARTLLEESLKA